MPVKPNSIIPGLIEKIFEKYEQVFKEQSKKDIFNSDSLKPLFNELDAIFGDVLKVALRLLDEQTITIYTTDKELRSIAEITEGRRSQRVIKLLANVNYCQCEFFATNVLQTVPPTTAAEQLISIPTTAALSTATLEEPRATINEQSYTCQHVLALRLAKLLKATNCLRTEILPSEKFKFLLKTLMTNENCSNDTRHSTSITTTTTTHIK